MKDKFKRLWKMEKREEGFVFKNIYYDKIKVLVEADTEDEAWKELYNFITD